MGNYEFDFFYKVSILLIIVIKYGYKEVIVMRFF